MGNKEEKEYLFEIKVGSIASYVLYASMLFILLQIIVLVITVLPGLFLDLVQSQKNYVTMAVGIFSEAILLTFVVSRVLGPVRSVLKMESLSEEERARMSGKKPSGSSPENTLEIMMTVSAVIAVLFYLVISKRQVGTNIVITTFEIFMVIFMVILAVVRFCVTRKVRILSLLSLAVVVYSLWHSFGPMIHE